uniref:hypothetical protein n=1 Tax=Lentilactobacillus hilgardii TaxID=1588 RepID=UPI00403F6794
MIIATGTLNIDENAKLAQQASDDAKSAANSAADEAGKVKTSLDGKITVSSQEPFDDGKTHDEGDIWYVQDSNHITSEMYTYDGSDWVKTKMSQTALSVGQLSALTADLGTIEAGYLNSVTLDSTTINGSTINAATINENSDNGTIKLDSSGFNVTYGNSYFKFVGSATDGYTQLRGGLNVDYIDGQGGIQMDGRIETQTQSMTGGSVFSCTTGALYFESNPNAGSGLIDIHAANIYGTLQGNFGGIISGNQISGSLNVGEISCTHLGTNGGDVDCASVDAGYHGVFPTYVKSAKFDKTSLLSLKKDIQNLDSNNALNQILCSDIKRYNYKKLDNTQAINVGPIIDDENEIGTKKYNVSNLMLNEDKTSLSIDNEVGLLMGAVQELSKRNSELSLRVTQLERKINNG